MYDVEEATHYAVISPVVWALALCWLIFACYTNHGGLNEIHSITSITKLLTLKHSNILNMICPLQVQ